MTAALTEPDLRSHPGARTKYAGGLRSVTPTAAASTDRSPRHSRNPTPSASGTTSASAAGVGFGIGISLTVLTALVVPLGTSNDDVILESLFTGRFLGGETSGQGLFTHVVVGWLISSLHGLVPSIPWFGLLLLLTHALASGSLLAIVAMRANLRSRTMAAAVLTVVSLDLWAVSELSWTSAAFAISVAGIVVGVAHPLEHDRSTIYALWSLAAITWGSLLRFESGIGAAIVLAPVVLRALTVNERRRKVLLVGALSALAVLGGRVSQFASFDADWQDFAAYSAVRGPLADSSRIASIDVDDPRLHGLDLTDTDLFLFETWFHDDPDVFGTGALTRLLEASAVDTTPRAGTPAADVVSSQPAAASPTAGGNLAEHGVKLIAVAAIGFLALGHRQRRDSAAALATIAIGLALIPAIMIAARMTGRVLIGLVMAAAWGALASISSESKPCPRFSAFGLGVATAAAVVSAATLLFIIGPANAAQQETELRRLEALEAADADGVFLLWEEPLGDLGLFADNVPDIELVLNGWLVSSPIQDRQLDRLGISDQFMAPIERDDVHLVTDDPDRVDAFINYVQRRRGVVVDAAAGTSARPIVDFEPDPGQ